ncbi:hypothetical protein FBU31_002005 [Coemansia sp. 'formosensis']|nr:hypothetical protein FBU31_002005 [Coemansia sp. 'formosensis']
MLWLRKAVADAQAKLERATNAFNVAKSAACSMLESTFAAISKLTKEEHEAVHAEQER